MSTRKLGRAVLLALVMTVGAVSLSGNTAFGYSGHLLLSQITQAPEGSPLGDPWALAFDASGNLFAMETEFTPSPGASFQAQVDIFDSTNAFLGAFGANIVHYYNARSVAVDHATGDVYVADSAVGEVYVFRPTGGGEYTLLSTWTGSNSTKGAFGHQYVSVAIDNSTSVSDPHAGDVYVLGSPEGGEPGSSRIEIFKPKPLGPEEAQEGELVGQLTTAGFELPQLGASAVVDSSTGALYVPDSGNQAVDEFNDAGAFVQAFKASGGPFQPFAVGVDESTHDIYVADVANNVIDEFDSSGEQIGGITQPSLGKLPLRGVAVNPNGHVYVSMRGAIDVFGAGVLLPDVTTGASQAKKGGATLEGVVNPDGQAVTSCQFEYGTTESYGQTAPCSPAAGSGSSPVTVTAKLSGLEGQTAYHYRLAAGNANGTHYGFDSTFTTPTTVELANEAASEVETGSATLNGIFIPGGLDTHVWFEYGLTSSYGSSTPHEDAGLGEGEELSFTAAHIAGLEPNTTYHFRLVAENEFGEAHAEDATFTTKAPPPVLSQQFQVSAITRLTAVVSTGINPEKSETTYHLVYGETSNYGQHTIDFAAGAGLGEQPIRVGLEGLEPASTYHYALVATNAGGTTIGPDETFTTTAAAPPTAVTGGASSVGLTTATLSGEIDAQGLETSYEFDLGTETTYGTSVYGEAGSHAEAIELSVGLQNLAPGTTYHYRIVAINSDGKTYGSDETFTTPAYSAPIILPSALPLIAAPTIGFPETTTNTSTPTKPLTKAQKLTKALKACKSKPKKKRGACERQARKKYGAKKKK